MSTKIVEIVELNQVILKQIQNSLGLHLYQLVQRVNDDNVRAFEQTIWYRQLKLAHLWYVDFAKSSCKLYIYPAKEEVTS
jgi:hypothetical protein